MCVCIFQIGITFLSKCRAVFGRYCMIAYHVAVVVTLLDDLGSEDYIAHVSFACPLWLSKHLELSRHIP